MRGITWALLVWTVIWIVAVWAVDPASTVGGKPPAWALFEVWAAGFVILGAARAGLLAAGASGRPAADWRRVRGVWGAAIVWTVLWMAAFPIWALDPDPTSVIEFGPGPASAAHLKPSEPLLYSLWAAGLVLLATVRLVARARDAGRRHADLGRR